MSDTEDVKTAEARKDKFLIHTFADLRLSRNILIFFFTVAMLTFLGDTSVAGNSRRCQKLLANGKHKIILSEHAETTGSADVLLRKSIPSKGFLEKTSNRTSSFSRNKVGSFADVVLISSNLHSRPQAIAIWKRSCYLRFESLQRKIIFPFHHFW